MPHVGIVGCGLIGRAWANVFARAGWDVTIYDAHDETRETAPELIRTSLHDLAAHGLVDDPAARCDASARLHRSDIVYLAGGNTYYFLDHLRRSGLLDELALFARRGGVVAGLSAGALILTPHIGLAGYPAFDRDENTVGLGRSGCRGLGLVGFEFFPHYRRSRCRPLRTDRAGTSCTRAGCRHWKARQQLCVQGLRGPGCSRLPDGLPGPL